MLGVVRNFSTLKTTLFSNPKVTSRQDVEFNPTKRLSIIYRGSYTVYKSFQFPTCVLFYYRKL